MITETSPLLYACIVLKFIRCSIRRYYSRGLYYTRQFLALAKFYFKIKALITHDGRGSRPIKEFHLKLLYYCYYFESSIPESVYRKRSSF